MIAFVVGFILVPVFDQSLKLLVLYWLGPRSFSLGPLGKLQVVRSRIWLSHDSVRLKGIAVWCMWLLAATGLCILVIFFPVCGWFAGVLVGGSLSHVLETAVRGWIVDYVRLRFWPAFNFADIAITVGALGIFARFAGIGD